MKVPTLLDIPKKMLPMISKFDEYRFLVAEGGRGGGKSVGVARFILYLGGKYKIRILCLREIMNSIEESVYQLLVDIIRDFNLDWDIKKSQLTHRKTGSTIRFRGCREQGAVSLKSMEGINLVWVEESQSMSKASLDILIPTIRKEKAKLFFTMNRFLRTDPVYEQLVHRDNCLHININYYDNPFCPEALKIEAAACKKRNEKDYKHIWLGYPLNTTSEYLFNFDKLDKLKTNRPFGDLISRQRVMSVDFASGGGDLCVATLLERTSNVHWKVTDQIAWSDPDTDVSVGKTIALNGEWHPDILIVDAGGLGYPMFINLSKSIKHIIGFDGGSTDRVSDPVSGNNRFQGYSDLKMFVDSQWLECTSEYTVKELETIKKTYQRSGKMFIQSKQDAKNKDKVDSPDRADSLMMGVFAIVHYLGKVDFRTEDDPIGMRSRRVNKRKRI